MQWHLTYLSRKIFQLSRRMQNTGWKISWRERWREDAHHGLQVENFSRRWYDEVRQSIWRGKSPWRCHQLGHQQQFQSFPEGAIATRRKSTVWRVPEYRWQYHSTIHILPTLPQRINLGDSDDWAGWKTLKPSFLKFENLKIYAK